MRIRRGCKDLMVLGWKRPLQGDAKRYLVECSENGHIWNPLMTITNTISIFFVSDREFCYRVTAEGENSVSEPETLMFMRVSELRGEILAHLSFALIFSVVRLLC